MIPLGEILEIKFQAFLTLTLLLQKGSEGLRPCNIYMSDKYISKEEVKKIADLANLDISGEVDRLSSLLSDTLGYIQTLKELDTTNVEETFQVTGLTSVFQDDSEVDSLTKEEALSNASDSYKGLFSTKPVFKR